jgi:hypothetical protein
LVQAFLKKWWVESDFKAPNLPLSLRLKGAHTSSTFDHVTTYTKQQDIVGEILFQNIVWKNTNTMKHKKYHTAGTFLKYN